MTTVVFRRPVRQAGLPLPRGEMVLQEPPTLPELSGADMSSMMTYLPAALGSGAMALVFIQPGASSLTYVAGGLMGVSGLGMLVGQMGRGGGDRKRRLRGERRDYLRYLGQMRRQVRQAAQQQAASLFWSHPGPDVLWSMTGNRRMWERRPTGGDFGEVRIGLGSQRLTLTLTPPQTKPVEDLEPLCARALRRFLEAHWTVPGLPIAVQLRGFARVLVKAGSGTDTAGAEQPARGAGPDDDPALGLVRAMLAQLTTFHSPDDLRVMVCASAERQQRWDWVKWLPHGQHPTQSDGAGAVRLVADSFVDLERLLGAAFAERPRFDVPALPNRDEPFVVIVVDGGAIPSTSRFAASSIRNATMIDTSGSLRWAADPLALRLLVRPDAVDLVGADTQGRDTATWLSVPDLLSVRRSRVLSRRLSPYRLGSSAETTDSLAADLDLTVLLGLGDPETFDPTVVRAGRSQWDRLRVPIGVGADGAPVELDLKESAQDGMGPHGLAHRRHRLRQERAAAHARAGPGASPTPPRRSTSSWSTSRAARRSSAWTRCRTPPR